MQRLIRALVNLLDTTRWHFSRPEDDVLRRYLQRARVGDGSSERVRLHKRQKTEKKREEVVHQTGIYKGYK